MKLLISIFFLMSFFLMSCDDIARKKNDQLFDQITSLRAGDLVSSKEINYFSPFMQESQESWTNYFFNFNKLPGKGTGRYWVTIDLNGKVLNIKRSQW